MRYSAAEKYEIIQLVQHLDLTVRQALAHLDIRRSTFYHWLKRYRDEGFDWQNDKPPAPGAAWNKIPLEHREAIIDLALDNTKLSPRELAVHYTDTQAYFVSESS